MSKHMSKNYRGNRFAVDWKLFVKHGDKDCVEGQVINVSAGGLFIECALALGIGDQVELEITDHWGEQLTAKVRVIWTRDADEPETGFGCRFEEMAEVDRRILNSLLSELLQNQISQASVAKKWLADDGSRDYLPIGANKAA